MGFGSVPKAPVVTPPPPSAAPATMANPAVAQAGANQKSKAASAAGSIAQDTNKSLETPATANTTLLGE